MTSGERSASARQVVRVLKSRGRFDVWFCRKGKRRALAGSIGAALAADAQRHGQDLVGELVDNALRMADRRAATR